MANIHPGQTPVAGIGSTVPGATSPEKLAAQKLIKDEQERQEKIRRDQQEALNRKRIEDAARQAAALERLDEEASGRPSFFQNAVRDVVGVTAVSSLVGEIAQEELDREQLASDQTKTQQEKLAAIVSASTPEATRLGNVTSAKGPNTPEFNRLELEQNLANQIRSNDESVKFQSLLDNYFARDNAARVQIENDVREATTAFRAIQNGKQTATPEQINQTNDVLIDFHRAVEATTLKDELAKQQAAKQATGIQTGVSPIDTKLARQQELELQEQARAKAKIVADEATAQLVRENRTQSQYLAELDRLHREREDQRQDIVTKREAERQAALNPKDRNAINLDPESRAKLEAQNKGGLQSDGGGKGPTFDKEGNYVDPHRKAQVDQEIDKAPTKFVQDYHEVRAYVGATNIAADDHTFKDVGFAGTHEVSNRRDPGRTPIDKKTVAPPTPRTSVTVDHGVDGGIQGVGLDPIVHKFGPINDNPNI